MNILNSIARLSLNNLDLYLSSVNKRYEIKVNEVIELLSNKSRKVRQLLGCGSFFVICGVSGSGKTTVIKMANLRLPEREKIAESLDILFNKDIDAAIQILNDDNYSYEGAKHVAYSIVRKDMGESLMKRGVSVVFMS